MDDTKLLEQIYEMRKELEDYKVKLTTMEKLCSDLSTQLDLSKAYNEQNTHGLVRALILDDDSNIQEYLDSKVSNMIICAKSFNIYTLSGNEYVESSFSENIDKINRLYYNIKTNSIWYVGVDGCYIVQSNTTRKYTIKANSTYKLKANCASSTFHKIIPFDILILDDEISSATYGLYVQPKYQINIGYTEDAKCVIMNNLDKDITIKVIGGEFNEDIRIQ